MLENKALNITEADKAYALSLGGAGFSLL